jgi:2-dehydro-3-deoxyphosphogluconate aldolase/(4S)-4-hydroxy-2-oxoglutarate aldolase
MLKRICRSRIITIAVLDDAETAVPAAEALLAGGLEVLEITFRTPAAAESIRRLRQALPGLIVGAGTLLSVEQLTQALDAGAQFGVAPGLNETVVARARECGLPFVPGVMTPSEVERALGLGCPVLKFFPAEAAGGVAMLKSLAGPYGHTGVKFAPTGGVSPQNLAEYLALPIVAAVGGSWLVERKLVAERNWSQITALAAEAVRLVGELPHRA